MLGEGIKIVGADGASFEERSDIRENGLLLIAHVPADAVGIVVEKFEDKVCEPVIGVECFYQPVSDGGQQKS